MSAFLLSPFFKLRTYPSQHVIGKWALPIVLCFLGAASSKQAVAQAPTPAFYPLTVTITDGGFHPEIVPTNQEVFGSVSASATGAPAAFNAPPGTPNVGYSYNWAIKEQYRRATSYGNWITASGATITKIPNSNTANLNGTFATPGYYKFRIEAVADWWYGTAEDRGKGTSQEFWVDLTVVQADTLKYRLDGEGNFAPAPTAPSPLIVAEGQYVEFEALPSPADADWPTAKPQWAGTAGITGDGGRQGINFNDVSATDTDYKTVTVKCGNATPLKADVLVVKVESLQYRPMENGVGQGQWQDVPEPLAVGLGTSIEFKAVRSPAIVDPEKINWPAKKPVWSGTSDVSGEGGDIRPITFSKASENSTDYKTVKAGCDDVVTANVLVSNSSATIKLYKNAKVNGVDKPDAEYSAAAAIGGPVWIALELSVGAGQRVDDVLTSVTLRRSEISTLHTDIDNRVDKTLLLTGDWEKWNGTNWNGIESPKTANTTTEAVKYRTKFLWATTAEESTPDPDGTGPQTSHKLWGHNEKHEIKLLQPMSFEAANGIGTATSFPVTAKNPTVGNLVINGVTTSANNPDYLKFNPEASNGDPFLKPTISFTIVDTGDTHLYNWRVRIRSTDVEDWTDSVLISGQANGPGNIVAKINDASAAGQVQSGGTDSTHQLKEWGTYTFEIAVDEVDSYGSPVGEATQNYRSQLLIIPHIMPGQFDEDGNPRPGHYLHSEKKLNGDLNVTLGHYLRDTTLDNTPTPQASELKVEFLPPSMGTPIEAGGLGKVINHAFVDVPLHVFTPGIRASGTYISVVTGADSHAKEYRDHNTKRILAKNGRLTGVELKGVNGDRVVPAKDDAKGLPGGELKIKVKAPAGKSVTLKIEPKVGTTGSAFFNSARTETTKSNVINDQIVTVYGGNISSAARNMTVVASIGNDASDPWEFTVFRIDAVAFTKGDVRDISGFDKSISTSTGIELNRFYAFGLSHRYQKFEPGTNNLAQFTKLGHVHVEGSPLGNDLGFAYGGIVIRGQVVPSAMLSNDFNVEHSRFRSFQWEQLISSRRYDGNGCFNRNINALNPDDLPFLMASDKRFDTSSDDPSDLIPNADITSEHPLKGELLIWHMDIPSAVGIESPGNGDISRRRLKFINYAKYANVQVSSKINWYWNSSAVHASKAKPNEPGIEVPTLIQLDDVVNDNTLAADISLPVDGIVIGNPPAPQPTSYQPKSLTPNLEDSGITFTVTSKSPSVAQQGSVMLGQITGSNLNAGRNCETLIYLLKQELTETSVNRSAIPLEIDLITPQQITGTYDFSFTPEMRPIQAGDYEVFAFIGDKIERLQILPNSLDSPNNLPIPGNVVRVKP